MEKTMSGWIPRFNTAFNAVSTQRSRALPLASARRSTFLSSEGPAEMMMAGRPLNLPKSSPTPGLASTAGMFRNVFRSQSPPWLMIVTKLSTALLRASRTCWRTAR